MKKTIQLMIGVFLICCSYDWANAQSNAAENTLKEFQVEELEASYTSKHILTQLINEEGVMEGVENAQISAEGKVSFTATKDANAEKISTNNLNNILDIIEEDYATLKSEGKTYQEIIAILNQKIN